MCGLGFQVIMASQTAKLAGPNFWQALRHVINTPKKLA